MGLRGEPYEFAEEVVLVQAESTGKKRNSRFLRAEALRNDNFQFFSFLLLRDLIQEHGVGDADALFVGLLQDDVCRCDGGQSALLAGDFHDFSYL